MDNKNTSSVITVVVGVVILAAIVGTLVAGKRGGTETAEGQDTETSGETGSSQKAVLVSHDFANGRHTYRGVISVPTPCHTLSYRVEQTATAPVETTIHFSVNAPSAGQVCAQVLKDEPFEVSYAGPATLPSPKATLNGELLLLIIGGKE